MALSSLSRGLRALVPFSRLLHSSPYGLKAVPEQAQQDMRVGSTAPVSELLLSKVRFDDAQSQRSWAQRLAPSARPGALTLPPWVPRGAPTAAAPDPLPAEECRYAPLRARRRHDDGRGPQGESEPAGLEAGRSCGSGGPCSPRRALMRQRLGLEALIVARSARGGPHRLRLAADGRNDLSKRRPMRLWAAPVLRRVRIPGGEHERPGSPPGDPPRGRDRTRLELRTRPRACKHRACISATLAVDQDRFGRPLIVDRPTAPLPPADGREQGWMPAGRQPPERPGLGPGRRRHRGHRERARLPDQGGPGGEEVGHDARRGDHDAVQQDQDRVAPPQRRGRHGAHDVAQHPPPPRHRQGQLHGHGVDPGRRRDGRQERQEGRGEHGRLHFRIVLELLPQRLNLQTQSMRHPFSRR